MFIVTEYAALIGLFKVHKQFISLAFHWLYIKYFVCGRGLLLWTGRLDGWESVEKSIQPLFTLSNDPHFQHKMFQNV